MFILGDLLPYQTVLWILLAIPLVHFCILLRLPDTPSYLIKCGRNEVREILSTKKQAQTVTRDSFQKSPKNLIFFLALFASFWYNKLSGFSFNNIKQDKYCTHFATTF